MRRLRLVHRMTLAMLATLLAVVALVALSLYAGVAQGFARYVRGLEEARLQPAVRRLEALYARDGDFGAIAEAPRRLRRLVRREEVELPRKGEPEPERAPDEGRPRQRPAPDPLEIPPRASLYDAAGRRVAGEGALETDASRLPVIVQGQTVGWLGLRAVPGVAQLLDLPYAEQVKAQLVGITAGALVLGLLGGWLLARRLARPLEEMGRGARQLASGDYSVRLPVQSGDELGQLAKDLNALAAALEEGARVRRQWVADTSHELLTPLAVLRAELEALQDGVRPLDAAALVSLRGETDRLERLVEDLAALARSDRGELRLVLEQVDLSEVLATCMAPLRGRFEAQRLAVSVQGPPSGPTVRGDVHRLAQLFTNLLENSLRYTDAGGRLHLQFDAVGTEVRVRFDDTAPGVQPELLPRLFERFFRAEPSRARAHGGSGLGLSICQRIVVAHGGRMEASASPLGGLRMEVYLPGGET